MGVLNLFPKIVMKMVVVHGNGQIPVVKELVMSAMYNSSYECDSAVVFKRVFKVLLKFGCPRDQENRGK